MSRSKLFRKMGIKTGRQLVQSKRTSLGHDYGDDWPQISAYIKKRDDYRCRAHKLGLAKCRHRFPPPYQHLLHVHHIIERLRGGSNHPSNLITLCKECHGKTHGRKLGKDITDKQKRAAGRM